MPAARVAGLVKGENSVTDDNDDFQDPMTPEEARNECLRFRAWNTFKESFTVFCGFMTTYFKSTSWPEVPARHKFCPETLVRTAVAGDSDLSGISGGELLRCRPMDNFRNGVRPGTVEMVPSKVHADIFNLDTAADNAEKLRGIKRQAGDDWNIEGIIPGKTPQGHCQLPCTFCQYVPEDVNASGGCCQSVRRNV